MPFHDIPQLNPQSPCPCRVRLFVSTICNGDTLWAIAKKYLGNGSRYKEIVSLNGLKSNVIYSGMKLKIPNK